MNFECTEEEFEVLEEVVQEGLKGAFGYCLALVLLGSKPGTRPTVQSEIENYRDDLERMSLTTQVAKLNFVDYSELPDSAKRKIHLPIFIARKQEAFKVLRREYSTKYDYYRDFGLFLGYPEEDVEWYVSEAKKETNNQYEKSKEKLGSPEDFEKIVSTTMYIPKPTEERYQAAKDKSEKYLKALRKADDKFNSEIGKELTEIQLNK